MFLPLAFARGAKGDVHAGLQHDISAPPGRAVGEPPAMTRTRSILGQQDVARMKGEVLSFTGLEVERAAERDHELPHRRGVPRKGAAGRRLLKRDARRSRRPAQPVAACAGRKIDRALLEVGIAVLAGPQSNTPNHDESPPLNAMQLGKVALRCLPPGTRSLAAPSPALLK